MIAVITGNNDLLRGEYLQKKISEFIKKNGDFSVEKITSENSDFNTIKSSMSSLPFLVSKKLIVLYEPGNLKEFGEYLEEILKMVSDDVDVIIYEPNIDKRTTYFKKLKKIDNFNEFTKLDGFKLSKWMVDYAAETGGKISSANAERLISRVGDNQLLLKNEIDKLVLFEPEITLKNIEAMTDQIPSSTIFNLLDSALSGNRKNVIKIFQEQKDLRVDSGQIMSLLAWQLHVLALVKSVNSNNISEVVSSSGLSRYTVEGALRLLTRIDIIELRSIVSRALELDVKLKTVTIDADEAVLQFLLTIKS
jgi:DNA polymerase-3 subunit delta